YIFLFFFLFKRTVELMRFFFFQAEDGIRDKLVTGVQTCALPILASRRGADELIKAGRVTVNGEPGQLNTFVESRDRVELDGEPVAPQELAYVLLHKPAGTVTTARDPHARRTVVDLVDHPARVVPVGRLDADTTGALLLTNDGPLAHRLAHPRYGVEKVYEIELDGELDDDALRMLAE